MRRPGWQLLIALGGMSLVALLLFDQSSLAEAPIAPTPQPQPGGIYTEAIVGTPRRLNPLLDTNNPVDRDLGRLIFSGLIRFDNAGRPQGDLAESWSVNPDGLKYTFSLRPNLRWHDDAPVTAGDVLFTIQLLQDPAYPGPPDLHSFWKDVQVTSLNELTVQFILPEPYAPFLDQLSVGLLPQHLLEGLQSASLPELDFNLRPIGTGPFRLEELISDGQKITGAELTPFAGYYGQRPFLTSLRFRFYESETDAFVAYQSREVDGLAQVTGETLPDVLAEPSLNLYTGREPRLTMIVLNLNNDNMPFFKDKQVRHALLAGLNRQGAVDTLLKGQAIVADSPILPGNWAFNETLIPVSYEPEIAEVLLQAAGWRPPPGTSPGDLGYVRTKDGRELSFTIVSPEDDTHRALTEAAQQNWALLGVRTGVKLVPAAQMLSEYLNPRSFEAILTELNLAHFPDPDPYPFWHQTQAESGQNYGQLDERSISESLELARITTNPEDRAKLYRTFQSRFAAQTPVLLLYYPVYNYAVSSNLRGITLGPLVSPADRFNTVADWHIVADQVEASPTALPIP